MVPSARDKGSSSTALSPVVAAAVQWAPHVVISGTSMQLTQLQLSLGSGASSKVVWFYPAECLQSAEEVRAWVHSAARMEAGLRAAVADDEALAQALAHVVFGRPRFRDWLVDAWREVMGASGSQTPNARQWRAMLAHVRREAIDKLTERVKDLLHLWHKPTLLRLLKGFVISLWHSVMRLCTHNCQTR